MQRLAPTPVPARRARVVAVALAAAALLAVGGATAEKADRGKPLVVEADQPGTVDLQRQVVVFSGNVVITQGTMVIRADRIELHQGTDGYRNASAIGSAARPATFRQKRDGADEVVEGAATRIDYDGRSDTLSLSGNAVVRRLRDGVVADEVTGALITWDNTHERFTVTGGEATPTNPSGRVRAVFTPAAASGPGSGGSLGGLQRSPALGGGK